jgi:hypothetical protein
VLKTIDANPKLCYRNLSSPPLPIPQHVLVLLVLFSLESIHALFKVNLLNTLAIK